MNTIKKHISAFLMLVLLFTQTATAYAQTTSACSLGTIVYYLNGVNKPVPSQVALDAKFLDDEIKSKDMVGYKKTDYLYNPSDSLFFDVLSELASQMAARRNASIADTFVQVGLAAWGAVTGMSSADQDEIRNKVATTILQYNLGKSFTINGDTFNTAQLVTKFKNTVSEQIRNGNKVVIVAHSQGNMFANDTYTAAKASLPANQSQGLAVVNIGNAASVASSGLYVTGKRLGYQRRCQVISSFVISSTANAGKF